MNRVTPSRKLTIADIDDIRAYERVRDTVRTEMIKLRNLRRVSVGTMVSLAFENRETIRFQIQEMARVERITTGEGIQAELDAYNTLVPEPGQLCATLFIELTSDAAVREWLPKLVGIEKSVLLRFPNGDQARGGVDAQHAAQLTRTDVTAAVHSITFDLTSDQCGVLGPGTVVSIDHPCYREETELNATTVSELFTDLSGGGARRTVTRS